MEQHIALGYPFNFENLDHDDCAGLRRKGEDIAKSDRILYLCTYSTATYNGHSRLTDFEVSHKEYYRRSFDQQRRTTSTSRVERPPADRLCASDTNRQTEESTISSFLQRPEDYQATVVIARSKWRYKNSLISLAIAIGILLTSILVFLTTYAIIAYIKYPVSYTHLTLPTSDLV